MTLNCPLTSPAGYEIICDLTIYGGDLGGGYLDILVRHSDGTSEILKAISSYSINKYSEYKLYTILFNL